jgi:AraC-like DNA-binding protein
MSRIPPVTVVDLLELFAILLPGIARGASLPVDGNKLVFSTDDLPKELDDRARFKLWQEIYRDSVGPSDTAYLSDHPFHVQWSFTPFQNTMVGRFKGTISEITRTARQAAASPYDHYYLTFNTGAEPLRVVQRGLEQRWAQGEATFCSAVETGSVLAHAPSEWLGVMIPCQPIREIVSAADDLLLSSFDRASPLMQHLQRYLGILSQPSEFPSDPVLARHIETTLIDLVALALGVHGDAAMIARMRGLRAARVRSILAEIAAGFADPSFSVSNVALRLGLSPRYIQDLLQETGASFTERVHELRLQRARTMLIDRSNDYLRVNEIALACGFNEVSYFHRCFRRRFGASPAEYRKNDRNGSGQAEPTA